MVPDQLGSASALSQLAPPLATKRDEAKAKATSSSSSNSSSGLGGSVPQDSSRQMDAETLQLLRGMMALPATGAMHSVAQLERVCVEHSGPCGPAGQWGWYCAPHAALIKQWNARTLQREQFIQQANHLERDMA